MSDTLSTARGWTNHPHEADCPVTSVTTPTQIGRFAAPFPQSGPNSFEDCAEEIELTCLGRCNLRAPHNELPRLLKACFAPLTSADAADRCDANPVPGFSDCENVAAADSQEISAQMRTGAVLGILFFTLHECRLSILTSRCLPAR